MASHARPAHRRAALVLIGAAIAGCASLGQLVQPPVFDLAPDRGSSIRLLGPSLNRPLGGAEIQVWARVENPNPIGFTLARLQGTVLLAGEPASAVDLPLGLPLEAAADTVIPLRLTLSFADVPDIADRLRDALSRGTVDYALRGTVAVDAGSLGQPTFGPRTWLQGDVALSR
jgi:hypothetical protein